MKHARSMMIIRALFIAVASTLTLSLLYVIALSFPAPPSVDKSLYDYQCTKVITGVVYTFTTEGLSRYAYHTSDPDINGYSIYIDTRGADFTCKFKRRLG
jgi:hypothetical protein